MKKYFRQIDKALAQRSQREIRVIAFLLLILISVADYLAGYEISTSLFFLVPIAMATWYGSYRQGVYFALLSNLIWFLIDTVYSGHRFSHPLIPYWNTGVRVVLFLIAAQFLRLLKIQSNNEKSLSRTDNLTGVMNRHGFVEMAENMFELSARHGRPATLAYIDLDNFKQVNDLDGHSEGDRVLITIGEILQKSLRRTEMAARLGGDEFAIALPETNQSGARSALNKLKENLDQAMQKHHWPVTFSIGVASFDTAPANFDEAIRLADALMYKVKNSGKNNILFEHYSPDNKDQF